ncbi:DUF4252 domain-containing protein [Faecalibacter macacae]|uniref:DUF4252 domain-containing protein n=2 Tax=Faecalibacter macacae TaxID=1859289 RepID=A0A3L9MCQ9_9FLAO|nr:DUF4252 domain-containing protein [Faecalibacter macacae]
MIMNKIIPFLALVLFTISSCSTPKNMSEFYDKYDKQSTVIPLPKFAINLAKKNTDLKILEYINSAKVFIITDAGKAKQNRVIKNLIAATKGENYEQMIKLKVKKNNVNAAYLEDKGQINQLILGVNGLRNVLVIDSKVNLTKEQLEEALDNVDLSELEDILK